MIVRATETVKRYTGINKNLSWDTLRPFVLQAEEKFAKPMLGKLYNVLDDVITSGTYTPEQKELLSYVYPMIANFTMYLAAPQVNIHVSDLGFQENTSKEGTSHPASITRYNDARLSFWRTADDYREFTYTYLQQQQSLFPDWMNSSAYTIYSKLFFRSNLELNEYLGMGSSVSTFLTLKAHIELCEHKYIQPILSDSQIEQLKTANRENTLTTEESSLLEKVKNALAWLTIYEAAPTLKAVIEDGVLVTALPTESTRMFQPLTEEQTNQIRTDAHAKGTMYLSRLKQFLDTNASNYPLYLNSTYHKTRLRDYKLPDNSVKKSFGLY